MYRSGFLAMLFFIPKFPSPALAESFENSRDFTVSAPATVTALAERAIITVGYQNQAETALAAREDNAKSFQKLCGALQELKFPLSILESPLVLESVADTNEGAVSRLQYRAIHELKVLVNASQAQIVLDAAFEAGANRTGSVIWRVASPTSLFERTNVAALANATHLARRMADAQELKLGDLRHVDNLPVLSRFELIGNCETTTALPMLTDAIKPVQISVPEIECTASATVSYALRK